MEKIHQFEELLDNLDTSLIELAGSHELIEEDSDVREKFDNVINEVNMLKLYLGKSEMNASYYF